MKKYIILIFVLLNFTIMAENISAKNIKIGCLLNYYFIADSTYKDIYGNGNIMVGGSVSYEISRNLELRGELNYFRDKGKMTLTKEKITFTIIPIVCALRYKVIELNKQTVYLGAGLNYYYYREKLPPRFKEVDDATMGYHFEIGSCLNLSQRFYMDFDLRYIFAKASAYEEKMKLGGIRAGIGIGYDF